MSQPLWTPQTVIAPNTNSWSGTTSVSLVAAPKPAPMNWVSDVVFENQSTIDGRHICKGALSWRDLPLTLMAMTVNSGSGHDGSFVSGRIDKLSKTSKNDLAGNPLPEGVTAVRGQGSFDVHGDGGEIARLVDAGMMRGVSADLAPQEIGLRDKKTGEVIPEGEIEWEHVERYFMGEMELAFIKATVIAATVCPTPAFDHAAIGLLASAIQAQPHFERHKDGIKIYLPAAMTVLTNTQIMPLTDEEPLTASAAPLKPPRIWFQTQELPGPTPLTITDEGRVFGHVALWDSCHVGFGNQCIKPPQSRSGYAYFHTGSLECEDGELIDIGKLMFNGKHAPLSMNRLDASRHYDDHSCVGAYVRASDGRYGIWISGSLRDDLDERGLTQLRANPLSGDWRPVNGQLELVAALAVPVPGFPNPRVQAGVVASGADAELTALVISSGEIVAGRAVTRALVAAGLLDEPMPSRLSQAEEIELLAAAAAENPIEALAELADG